MNRIIAYALGLIPLPATMRGGVYRVLYHGHIGKHFRVGYGSYIIADNVQIGDNVAIKKYVRIWNIDKLEVGDCSEINSRCSILGPDTAIKNTERKFVLGRNSGIGGNHKFDIVATISIGDRVIVAGNGSQFYTHSFDLNHDRLDGDIMIGNDVYIGTGCLVTPGVNICDNVVIAGWTCVNKSITESGVYSSYQLYRKGNIREYRNLYKDKEPTHLINGQDAYHVSGIKKI